MLFKKNHGLLTICQCCHVICSILHSSWACGKMSAWQVSSWFAPASSLFESCAENIRKPVGATASHLLIPVRGVAAVAQWRNDSSGRAALCSNHICKARCICLESRGAQAETYTVPSYSYYGYSMLLHVTPIPSQSHPRRGNHCVTSWTCRERE